MWSYFSLFFSSKWWKLKKKTITEHIFILYDMVVTSKWCASFEFGKKYTQKQHQQQICISCRGQFFFCFVFIILKSCLWRLIFDFWPFVLPSAKGEIPNVSKVLYKNFGRKWHTTSSYTTCIWSHVQKCMCYLRHHSKANCLEKLCVRSVLIDIGRLADSIGILK